MKVSDNDQGFVPKGYTTYYPEGWKLKKESPEWWLLHQRAHLPVATVNYEAQAYSFHTNED